jgi:hypothetical protein
MKIYCQICESAWIETSEVLQEPVYRCTMCNDYLAQHESDRKIEDENINYDLVEDYGS